MLSKNEMLEIVQAQLAIEFTCEPSDFMQNENIISTSQLHEKRRKFTDKLSFFKMVTMGGNAIISADEVMHEWLSDYVEDKPGHWLFEFRNLIEIENQLAIYGKKIRGTSHMFLPFNDYEIKCIDYPVCWYEGDDIHQFYNGMYYTKNAICPVYNPNRPDTLVVVALDDNKIIGMAGCSADTDIMWQIGIDVDEKYRGKGIGAFLVNSLKKEIFSRGKLPYYGTSLSNIHSWKIALSCGFVPVWVETGTIED